MVTVRVDTHAHLYDEYPLREWCDAAARNLALRDRICGVVIVVDREGQDSFARFRAEANSFGQWREAPAAVGDGVSEIGLLEWSDHRLVIVRGVQYVSQERVEVLALGVGRSVPDGAPASELVDLIHQEGGVPCLPWSPGKWFGKRGCVVATILNEASPRALVLGDIAIRSLGLPPSGLLWKARRRGFPVLCGTDPLPRREDCSLVGSFGVCFSIEQEMPDVEMLFAELIRPALCGELCGELCGGLVQQWGWRNSPIRAIRRFISTL
jgi:hypothetical protein